MTDAAVAVPLGFVLGFLIGLTGVGGGALVAPALYVVLGLGYGEAVTLSLVYSLFTKIVGVIQHVRQGTVLWRISLLYGLAGVPGAVVGSRLVYLVDARVQRALPLVMAAVLGVVAAAILLESSMRALAARPRPLSPHSLDAATVGIVAAIQLGVGVLLGVTSVGSGSLVIVSMLFLFEMSGREIVGSNIVIALIMVVPAGLTHYLGGGMDWRLLGWLLAGSLGGAVLGARATLRVPDRLLKATIAALAVLGALATAWKAQG